MAVMLLFVWPIIDSNSDEMKKVKNITSFLNTTIDGNVVATGLLMVGSGNQSNAGISGLNEAGPNSVRLWAGGTAQNRRKANWLITDSGIERRHHKNGQLAKESGYVNGSFVENYYHPDGYLLFKLDPSRGLVNVAYTQESWTSRVFFRTGVLSKSASDAEIRNTIQWRLKFEDGYWFFNEEQHFDYQCWEYFNGTIPTNAGLQEYNGYKASNGSRTNNIPDGWYVLFGGPLEQNSTTGKPTIVVTFIQNGIELEMREIIFTGI